MPPRDIVEMQEAGNRLLSKKVMPGFTPRSPLEQRNILEQPETAAALAGVGKGDIKQYSPGQLLTNDATASEAFFEGFAPLLEVLTEAGTSAMDKAGISDLPDPDFSLDSYRNSTSDENKRILDVVNENPAESAGFLERWAEVKNAEQADFLMDQVRKAEHNVRIAAQHPGMNLLGIASGFGADMITFAALALLTGGAAVGGRLVTGAGSLKKLTGFGALAGSAEAGGYTAAQSVYDPNVTRNEVMMAQFLGTVLGGGAAYGLGRLGLSRALAEQQRMGRASLEIAESQAAFEGRAVEAGAAGASGTLGGVGSRRSVGASGVSEILARAPRSNIPGPATGTLTGTGRVGRGILGSPVRVIEGLGQAAKKLRDKFGITASLNIWDSHLSRIISPATKMQDEVVGAVGRDLSFDRIIDQYARDNVGRQIATDLEFETALKEVFGDGAVARQLKPSVTKENYMAAADEVAQALGMGAEDQIDGIIKKYMPDLGVYDRVAIEKHLRATAKADDDFYRPFGEMMVALGRLRPEQLIDGYRPQVWNRAAIMQDEPGFRQFLRDMMAKSPPDEVIDDLFPGVRGAGETFDDIVRRDPELARDIADTYAGQLARQAELDAEVRQSVADEALAALKVKDFDELDDVLRRNRETAQETIDNLNRQLDELPEGPQRDRMAVRIARAERNLAREEGRAALATRARDDAESLRRLAARLTAQSQRAARQLSNDVQRNIETQIDEIIENIRNSSDVRGMLSYGSTGRLKDRQLNLGRSRFSERARQFLVTNSDDLRTSFVRNVGGEAAFRRIFQRAGDDLSLPQLRERTIKEARDTVKTKLDSMKLDSPGRKELQKFYDDVFGSSDTDRGFLEGFLDQHLPGGPAKRLFVDTKGAEVLSGAQAGTAAARLGFTSITQLGDIAPFLRAGGSIAAGLKELLSPIKNRRLLKALRERSSEISITMEGVQNQDGRRIAALIGIDDDTVQKSGTWASTFAKRSRGVAKAEAFLSGASMWNRWLRPAAAISVLRQSRRNFAKWDELTDSMKSYYAKFGVGRKEAKQLDQLMNKHHIDIEGEWFPDRAAWDAKAPGMFERWQIMMNEAAGEFHLHPGASSRPFIMHYPEGRFIAQFSQFGYLAMEKFIAPMVQDMMLDPKQIGYIVAPFFGLLVSSMGMGLRAAVLFDDDKWDEWTRSWESPGGVARNLMEAFERSPMMVSQMGHGVDLLKELLGANRRHGGSLVSGLTGPAIGLITKDIPESFKDVLEGDLGGLQDRAERALPLYNTLSIQIIENLLASQMGLQAGRR